VPTASARGPTLYRPDVRRALLPLYALILVGEVAWQQLVPLAPDLKGSLGLDATRTGILLAATPLAIVAVSLPAGVATDRLDAAWLTVAATILCGAACVAQGMLSDSYTALIICRIVFGFGFAFIWTSGIAWLADAAGIEHRTRTLSITLALAGMSSFVGPGFAGLLAERAGPGLPFTLAGIALLVLAFALVGPARGSARETIESVPLREWIGRTLGSRVAVAGLVTMTAGGLAMSAINLLVPLDLNADGIGSAGIGAIYAASACFFTLTSIVGARLGNRIASPVLGGVTLLGLAGLTVLPFLREDLASITGFLLARAPFTALLFASAFAVALVGADEVCVGRGAMMGLLNLVWAAASFAGPPLAGALRDSSGRQAAWIALTALLVAGAPVGLRAGRNRRGMVAAPPSP
jgi:MFS family permease